MIVYALFMNREFHDIVQGSQRLNAGEFSNEDFFESSQKVFYHLTSLPQSLRKLSSQMAVRVASI
jgi:hypothetical protein